VINQTTVDCYVCERLAVTNHEPLMGSKYRQLSIDYNLRIPVCAECHKKMHDDADFNEIYQKEMQRRFEEGFDHATWMKIFGRNYL